MQPACQDHTHAHRRSRFARVLIALALAGSILPGCRRADDSAPPADDTPAPAGSNAKDGGKVSHDDPGKLGPFAFIDLAGETVSHDSLLGKVVVLVWFDDRESSRDVLRQVDEVRRKHEDRDDVVVLAVSAAPESVENRELASLLERWHVTIDVVRDGKAHGRDVFRALGAPTLIVLSEKGVLQVHEPGAHPETAQLLAMVIDKLLAGENLWPLPADSSGPLPEMYERSLAAAAGEGATRVVQLPETTIGERTEPQRVTLERLWTCTDLKAPGNILVIDSDDGPTILVNDGWRDIARIDQQGRVVSTHALPIPAVSAVSYLLAATDAAGRRYYVAAAGMAKTVHVLDQDWKLVADYPDKEQRHDGISDVAIGDLDGDGTPELCVGFWGLTGVHSVTLRGENRWRNRSVTSVLSVVMTAAGDVGGGRVLVAGADGRITAIDAMGRRLGATPIAGRAIHRVFPARFSAKRPTAFCGLSSAAAGNLVAVGLSAELKETFSYELPPGIFQSPIRPVTSGRLLDRPGGQWILAGPDGSIHIISDDGDFFDYFQYGQRLDGLAVARFVATDGRKAGGVLLVSTAGGVTAWQVTLRGEL